MSDERTESDVPAPEQTVADSGRIWPTQNYSFLLQAIMDSQRTLGEVKNAVESLQSTVGQHGNKIDRISHIVYAAGAVLAVLVSIAAFLLNKIWDRLVMVLSGAT